MPPTPSPGVKNHYLIRRRPGVTRDELVAHWFANHMPGVIAGQQAAAAKGRVHAYRYIATLFDVRPDAPSATAWDGVAELWWTEAIGRPEVAHGTVPADSFQEKAEPYVPWATHEYVLMDGSEHLPVTPLTLNAPFPSTRSGFYKVAFLIRTRPGGSHQELFDHWVTTHADNVCAVMREVGGFRYVVSTSIEPDAEPFAGIAELYFPDAASAQRFLERLQPDGFEKLIDPTAVVMLSAQTEMVGIA